MKLIKQGSQVAVVVLPKVGASRAPLAIGRKKWAWGLKLSMGLGIRICPMPNKLEKWSFVSTVVKGTYLLVLQCLVKSTTVHLWSGKSDKIALIPTI